MISNISPVSQYVFTTNEKFFFDANIWLFLFGPQTPKKNLVDIYSKAFSEIVKVDGQIYIDVLVLSEYINRHAKLEYELADNQSDSFKTFRDSTYFESIAKGISVAVKIITDYCTMIDSGYDTVSITNLMDDYVNGGTDFNDQIISEICRNNGFTLVTHDGDFKSQDIPILTANYKLLDSI
ncbi:hypothetical protein C6497_04510 [Candidatus Poribacteria bacterium]|nr:MAG: hypothetical protein C6497_04510 [Candidatus Poribacteria bacterium]